MKIIWVYLSTLSSLVLKLNCGEVGDNCVDKFSRREGVCILIQQCAHVLNLLEKRRSNEITNCGFIGTTPIVCCPDTVLDPVTKDPKFVQNPDVNPKCSLYYDIRKSPEVTGHGGFTSSNQEFPHMAIIGYGDSKNIQWLCGGSLVSEKYILTAAHCLRQRNHGPASYVRLGNVEIDENPQDFLVSERISHPHYKRRSHYHDIALLKLNRFVDFNQHVKPSCLFVKSDVADHQLIATGWMKVDFHLLKMHLRHVSYEVCTGEYSSSSSQLIGGIVDEIQICAGDQSGTHPCPGDYDGPLQTLQQGTTFYWTIVGITSFGKACGVGNSSGVYTRVAPYASWIESIVWPN